MAAKSSNTNIDGAELFTNCLSQATLIVKQVLPSHFTNATPDVEWDVRDLTDHMLTLLESVSTILSNPAVTVGDELFEEDEIDNEAVDLSIQWQAAADRAEAAIADIDVEEVIQHNGDPTTVEAFLIEIAGDLLIHAWDLGEAIGMPVHFQPMVAEAVMETTVVPTKLMVSSHNLLTEPLSTPANADLQTRLLALFGRSHAWRAAA